MKGLKVLTLTCGMLLVLAPALFGAGGGGGGGGSSGSSCTPSDDWVEYGFALPGDPDYGFGFPDPNTRDFLGLAAKGNVVVGDYTSQEFQDNVLPKLTPGPDSLTQPYVIDQTDADLGYHDYGFDGKGRPRFSGNYDQPDGGTKLDGSSRKFYESTLKDADFTPLIESRLLDPTKSVRIDAVIFTNHALAGLVKSKSLTLNGSMVSRDDGLMFGHALYINHDLRLFSHPAEKLALPFSIQRPRLIQWEECPPDGCTP